MGNGDYGSVKDVARANREFYRAFEQLDLDAMRAVWLDDDVIQCVHPASERLIGRERVHGSWEAIFRATDAISFELADLSIEVFGDSAWVSAIERIRPGRGGEPASEAVATHLFLRTAAGWKLVLHHASPIARHFFPG